jgi:hypothetical protein
VNERLKHITPLNLSGKDFCNYIGVTYDRKILKQLREQKLVIGFFKIGTKYFYPTEEGNKLSEFLRKNIISIKTDNGYYITINDYKAIEKKTLVA